MHRRRLCAVSAAFLLALGCAAEPEGDSESDPEMAPRVEAADIDGVLAGGALLLDVRTAEELAEHGTIEGFVHIPIGELEGRLDELPRGVPILTA